MTNKFSPSILGAVLLLLSLPTVALGESLDIVFNLTDYIRTTSSGALRVPQVAQRKKATKLLLGTASSSGDAHFKTFGGQKFDFTGGCDLVLLASPKFADGLGLNIHIRTKRTKLWTSISSAVVQIGDQMLELGGGLDGQGQPRYWVNGERGSGDVDTDERLEYIFSVLSADFPGFSADYVKRNDRQHEFHVKFNDNESIRIKAFQDWVAVVVKVNPEAGTFVDVSGMIGSFSHGGLMVGRDGHTILEDPVTFAREWQVRQEEDPMLFHDVEGQQPRECDMPNQKTMEERKQRNIRELLINPNLQRTS